MEQSDSKPAGASHYLELLLVLWQSRRDEKGQGDRFNDVGAVRNAERNVVFQSLFYLHEPHVTLQQLQQVEATAFEFFATRQHPP